MESLMKRLAALGKRVEKVDSDPEVYDVEARREFADWHLETRRSLAALKERMARRDGDGWPSAEQLPDLRAGIERAEREFERARARFGL
jgi:hypothetical protein